MLIQKILIITILLFTTMNIHAEMNNKQVAYSSVRQFFNIKNQKIVLDGHFQESDEAYGQVCKIYIDFTQVGEEYLTVVGEFTPIGTIGDGIYFNEDKSTFQQVKQKNGFLSLEQKITDSFSTGMKTRMELRRNINQLELFLYQNKQFLFFFTQTIEKKCIVDNFKNKKL